MATICPEFLPSTHRRAMRKRLLLLPFLVSAASALPLHHTASFHSICARGSARTSMSEESGGIVGHMSSDGRGYSRLLSVLALPSGPRKAPLDLLLVCEFFPVASKLERLRYLMLWGCSSVLETKEHRTRESRWASD